MSTSKILIIALKGSIELYLFHVNVYQEPHCKDQISSRALSIQHQNYLWTKPRKTKFLKCDIQNAFFSPFLVPSTERIHNQKVISLVQTRSSQSKGEQSRNSDRKDIVDQSPSDKCPSSGIQARRMRQKLPLISLLTWTWIQSRQL